MLWGGSRTAPTKPGNVLEDFLESLVGILEKGERAAVSSVIARSGSVPAPANAKLLVRSDGQIVGTVGGGALEADVHAAAKKAVASGRPIVQQFDFWNKVSPDSLQICGGKITVYTEVVHPQAGQIALYRAALERLASGQAVALATAVLKDRPQTPAESLHLLFGREGIVAGALAQPDWQEAVIASALPLFDGEDSLFVEPQAAGAAPENMEGFLVEFLHPAPVLVVFGGGHVGLALYRLGLFCGYRVVVVDDRPDFAAAERFPQSESVICSTYSESFEKLSVDSRHYLVSVTRCHNTDRQVVEKAVHTPAAYLGMIGSRRKVMLLWEELEKNGIERALLDKVHAPVGLDIGAETPEEIALSIMAQITAVRRDHKPAVIRKKIRLNQA